MNPAEPVKLGAPVLWATIVLPTLIALVFHVLGLRSPRAVRALAYLSALILVTPTFLVLYYLGYRRQLKGIVDPLSIDLSAYNIGYVGLAVDGLSAPVVAGISIVTALVAVYSVKYMEHRVEELHAHGVRVPGLPSYFILYNAFSSSMLGMAYSTNLVGFFVFLELSLITSFLLIAFYGYGDRLRIALMYFIWTHVGGALFLAGILYYGVNVGSFDILSVTSLDYNREMAIRVEGLAVLAPLFIIVGLLVKMAVFGVHMWLPYAHAEAPTPISALLSPNLIGVAGYALARFSPTMFPQFIEGIRDVLVFLAFITIVYGGLVALRENDFKRFLAYSSISQMGYLLLGIATLTSFGVAGAMLHYLAHAIGKAVLFMVAGVFIVEVGGLRNMALMGGFARVYPTISALSLLGFMHLVGMPPSLGMWSEILILLGLIESYNPASASTLLAIAVIVVAAFMVTASYSFIAMRRIFFGQPRQPSRPAVVEVMDEFKIAILVIALSGVLAFLAVDLILEPLRLSVIRLLEPLGGVG